MAVMMTSCIYEDTWKVLILFVAFYYLHAVLKGLVVNGEKVVTPFEESSSPSQINAAKGSSVRLYWSYSYIGDGPHDGIIKSRYKEQVIGFNSTSQPSIQALAKRSRQNGALKLESPVPAPFSGRAEVISSNSTLVIHNLQYNDSAYQFSSTVKVDIDPGDLARTNEVCLKPIVSLIVTGKPDFIEQPPHTLEVIEGSNLQLRIVMDGNPKPSADFRWLHHTGSSPTNITSFELHPFVYSSVYTLNNISASYCGRILETTIKNRLGASTEATKLTMMLKLNHHFDLKARKNAASKCVEVKWNKAKSGACCVKYAVVLKDASGNVLHVREGCNIYKMKICSLKVYTGVANVQLTAKFKNISKTVFEKVSEQSISTPALITQRGTSQTDNLLFVTSLLHTTPVTTENPVSISNATPISVLNFALIWGLSAGVVVLRIVLYGIHWCKKHTTVSGLIQIRSTHSSTESVHLDIHAP